MAIYYVDLSNNSNPSYIANDPNNAMGWAEFIASLSNNTFYLKGTKDATGIDLSLSGCNLLQWDTTQPWRIKLRDISVSMASGSAYTYKGGILDCRNFITNASPGVISIYNMYIKASTLFHLERGLSWIRTSIRGSTIVTPTFRCHAYDGHSTTAQIGLEILDSVLAYTTLTIDQEPGFTMNVTIQNSVSTSTFTLPVYCNLLTNVGTVENWVSPIWPAWNAIQDDFFNLYITVNSITRAGTPPFTGYETDAWGNSRMSIGFGYMIVQLPQYINWVMGYPKVSAIGIQDIDVLYKTDNNGTVYFVTVLVNSPAPSASQIKSGNDASDSPVANGKSGNGTISISFEKILSSKNLQTNITYDIYSIATSLTNNDTEISKLTVTPTETTKIQENIQKLLAKKLSFVSNWPRKSLMPKPNNYREFVISRNPISYWRLGENNGELVAKDDARYINGEYQYSLFDGNSYKSYKNKAVSSANSPIQVNDNNLSGRFTWETDLLYNKPKGTSISIPHKSRFVNMSTMLLEFFMKADLPKGKNGTLISKTDESTTAANVIYREYKRVTSARNYEVVNYNYTANMPFTFECDFKPDWDCSNDKYIIAFGVDEATDAPTFNYGIANQRLLSYNSIYDSTVGSILQNVNHHLKLVYNGTNLQVYLDEVLVNTRAVSISAASQIRIGNYHNRTSVNDDDWFVGEIRNMKLTFNPVINPAFHVELDNGRLKAIVGNGTSTISVLSSSVITDQNWHYVIVLFKNRVLKIYIDNVLVGTSAALSSDYIFPANTSPIQIARTSNQALWSFFQGYLDEIAIYDHDWYS